MPLQKFLELDSTYRNRNVDPNPGCFTVTVSQTGLKNQKNAVDPVSNAYPEIIFNPSKYYNTADTPSLSFNFIGEFTLDIYKSTSSTLYLKYIIDETTKARLPYEDNLFVGAKLLQIAPNINQPYPFRRINEWTFLQQSANNMYFKISLSEPFSTIDISSVINNDFVIVIDEGFFLPASYGIPQYYKLYVVTYLSQGFSKIIDFDSDSHVAVPDAEIVTDSKNFAIRKESPIISSAFTGSSTSNIKILIGNLFFQNTTVDTVINAFLHWYRISDTNEKTLINDIKKIVAVQGTSQGGQTITVNAGDSPSVTLKNEAGVDITYNFDTLILSDPLLEIPQPKDYYEILQYSYDNYSPFVYSGTLSSNSQPVAYEMTLNSLTLPNTYLVGGGRIAYFPYVYVNIENISTTQGNPKNVILSNNPNTYRAIFRVPITDLNHPKNTPFVKLTGNGMKQTIMFKQNDDVKLTITLPDGQIFQTFQSDTSNGQKPNPTLQISAVFSMERIN